MVVLRLVLVKMMKGPPLLSLSEIPWNAGVVVVVTECLIVASLANETVWTFGRLISVRLVEGLCFRIRPSIFGGSLVLTVISVSRLVSVGAILEGPVIMA